MQVIFRKGEDTEGGLFMVVDGNLAVYRVEHGAGGAEREILSYFLIPGA